jgi:hypothetical protein
MTRPLRTALFSRLQASSTRAARRLARLAPAQLPIAVAAIVALAAPLLAFGFAFAIERFPALGPWAANHARHLVGTHAVAWLEDRAYDAEDRSNRLLRRGELPKAYWQPPPPSPPAAATTSGEEGSLDGGASFHPTDVGPMRTALAAAGDGVWTPVRDSERPSEEPILYKTLLHPDEARPWAEVFVVAIDLARVNLFSVAGAEEPEALTPEGHRYTRPALIPPEHQRSLVAAFNGGWKTDHGQYGMEVDDVVLVPPKERACTVAIYDDGSLRIATWTALSGEGTRYRSWRQTPPCLYENGSLHAGLLGAEAWAWGAAVGGETIIRRSAIGLDAERRTLFVSVANATKVAAIAEAMHHAGASDVAELDVNWSFPKFATFRADEHGERVASGLFNGFVVDKDEYLRTRARKDFFYLIRRESPGAAADLGGGT